MSKGSIELEYLDIRKSLLKFLNIKRPSLEYYFY